MWCWNSRSPRRACPSPLKVSPNLGAIFLGVKHRALYQAPRRPDARYQQERRTVEVALAFQPCLMPAKKRKRFRKEGKKDE